MTTAKYKAALEQQKINLPLLMLFFGFCLLISYDPNLYEVVISAVADAYLQVSTFVAATLLIFFSLEKFFNFDLSEKLKLLQTKIIHFDFVSIGLKSWKVRK